MITPIDFILHIGAPKTGTSSIQGTLRRNSEVLSKQKIKYLGLCFEEAYEKKYKWQNRLLIAEFNKSNDPNMKKELYDIISSTIKKAKEKEITTLILSNESFLMIPHQVLPLLKKLDSENKINLKVVVFVRDYVKWAQSAYLQWGIKHKAQLGKVKPYDAWKGQKVLYFYKEINNIQNKYKISLIIKNMDFIDDVVDSFASICKIEMSNIKKIRINDTPSNEEMFLRALYNGKFNESVKPSAFEDNVIGYNSMDESIDSYMDTLMPSETSLERIRKLTQADNEKLNTLLVKQGEKEILPQEILKKNMKIDTNKLLRGLADIVLSQSIRISKLEKDMQSLKGI